MGGPVRDMEGANTGRHNEIDRAFLAWQLLLWSDVGAVCLFDQTTSTWNLEDDPNAFGDCYGVRSAPRVYIATPDGEA